MPDMDTVCFTGHRHIAPTDEPALRRRLRLVLSALYDLGFRRFLNGGALGFDLLAAEEVLALRDTHPDMFLEIAIPFTHQCDAWPQSEQQRYECMLIRADKLTPLASHYFRGVYLLRNRYMVDLSHVCVAYYDGSPTGGTSFTACYALRKERPVLNVFSDAMAAEGLQRVIKAQKEAVH